MFRPYQKGFKFLSHGLHEMSGGFKTHIVSTFTEVVIIDCVQVGMSTSGSNARKKEELDPFTRSGLKVIAASAYVLHLG